MNLADVEMNYKLLQEIVQNDVISRSDPDVCSDAMRNIRCAQCSGSTSRWRKLFRHLVHRQD